MSVEFEKKFYKSVIVFFILAFAIKNAHKAGFFESKNLNGKGYKMKAPAGWIKSRVPEENEKKADTTVATFVTPQIEPTTRKPEAKISVFALQLEQPLWIEDEFPTILSTFKKEKIPILDKGEIKLNDQLFKWVLIHDERSESVSLFRLTFFSISDAKVFYRIEYTATPKNFNKHREAFEAAKETFQVNFSI